MISSQQQLSCKKIGAVWKSFNLIAIKICLWLQVVLIAKFRLICANFQGSWDDDITQTHLDCLYFFTINLWLQWFFGHHLGFHSPFLLQRAISFFFTARLFLRKITLSPCEWPMKALQLTPSDVYIVPLGFKLPKGPATVMRWFNFR